MTLAPFALPAVLSQAKLPTVQFKNGITITRSCRILGGNYAPSNADDAGKSGVITIRGENLVVDCTGLRLQGTPIASPPDQRKGTAVIVAGKNVTIRGLRTRGYRFGLVARDVEGLRLYNCDFGYGWKQRLRSTIEREDEADWMSYHRNEKDEWMRFGTGIYLRDCDKFEVKGCTVEGGQNGLMLTNCDGGLVWNNSFSFLSACGLAMYNSSDNRIMHNNIDWCVRGYSHGRWNRGQDSAGIIIYEQSHRNIFAYNSVTHGGDGFFLWAGQTTMDTGQGGCNDNLLYGNDWSHAPTNGIEATFSRNQFVNNLIMECWHGIWGGYSYDTLVLGNVFAYNAEGIALEHGQDNKFYNNLFFRDNMALSIWQNPSQDPNWGYPKNRDTRSRDSEVSGNLFFGIGQTVASVRDTINFKFLGNAVMHSDPLLRLQGTLTGFDWGDVAAIGTARAVEELKAVKFDSKVDATIRTGQPARFPRIMQGSGNLILPYPDRYDDRFVHNWNPYPGSNPGSLSLGRDPLGQNLMAVPSQVWNYAPKPLPNGRNPFLKPGQARGRKYILVDEWGPYDFKSPKIWPRGLAPDDVQKKTGDTDLLRFEVLGPPGRWVVRERRGFERLFADDDRIPGHFDLRLTPGQVVNVVVGLDYIGDHTLVTPMGETIPKGKPYRFEYRLFRAPIDWTVSWYNYAPKTQEPRSQPEAFRTVIGGSPVKTEKTTSLDYSWGGSPAQGVGSDHFATVAEGRFTIFDWEYFIDVTTDDGCRVWLDDKLIVDSWKWQVPTTYTVKVKLGGDHKLRVEHFEIDGFSTLKVGLRPAKDWPKPKR
ncbi:MAG: hypothetical protein HONBIEJF_02689 [Fimbriimonadaceae bacterium]|nr:hypothetical protein [Fimbriimonadaceae bacterium]